MTSIIIGKVRRLQQCATAGGKLVMFALDHRGNLQRALNPWDPQSVTYEQMVSFKLGVAEAMTPVSSAILLDPQNSASQAIAAGVIDKSCGLLVAVEKTGYTGDPTARESQILPGWSVEKISRIGADGVKLLIYYHPEVPNAIQQEDQALGALVRDHYAILKVGPGLTFAFREAIFALAEIEKAWLNGRAGFTMSNVRRVVDRAMLENPVYWQSYYPGNDVQQHYARQYSLSDRIRYYWPVSEVTQSINRLLGNLRTAPIPLPLLSQYLPDQFRALRENDLANDPESLIESAIVRVLDDYAYACRQAT